MMLQVSGQAFAMKISLEWRVFLPVASLARRAFPRAKYCHGTVGEQQPACYKWKKADPEPVDEF
jgi:hypothetical protein